MFNRQLNLRFQKNIENGRTNSMIHFNTKTFSMIIAIILMISGTVGADPIVTTYEIPEYSSGLAWDGEFLWIGGIGERGEWIRSLDPESGLIVDSIRAPIPDCIGLAAFNGGLAYQSPRSDSTYFVDRNGSMVAFGNPLPNLGGLGKDGSTFWSATFSVQNGTILQLDSKGRVLRSMPFTGRHTRDAAFHRGRIFVADRLAQEIREVNPESGRFVRTFETPGNNPDGLTSDGTYLWMIDDGEDGDTDRLYKVLTIPDGNIRFSRLHHNYGSVEIGELVEWDLWVFNDGNRRARLIDLQSRNGNEDIFVPYVWRFPEYIAGGDSALMRFAFQPGFGDSVRIEWGFTYDIDQETYWVDLRGKGIRRQRNIVVNQRVIDFGQTRCGELVNGSNLRYLEIESEGGEALRIEELSFSNPSFWNGYYDFPHTFVEPGLYRIPIYFRPDRFDNRAYRESVLIRSNDPDSPEITVILSGTTELDNYSAGEVLWTVGVGNRDMPVPLARAIKAIDDVTGDGLADVVIASNDYSVRAYHAASTSTAIPIWTYYTDTNQWRRGLAVGPEAVSNSDDFDGDGVRDIIIGLSNDSKQVIALSGRTGEEIWIFDSNGMHGSGGDIIVANGERDFNDDGVFDVFAAISSVNEQHTTNALILLNGSTGRLIWELELDNSPMFAFLVPDFNGDRIDDLAVVLEDGTVHGVDGRRGRIVWENEVSGSIRSAFALLGDTNGDGSTDIGFQTYNSGITVLNGSNGIRLWNNRAHPELQKAIATNDVNGNGSPDILYGDDFVIRAIDGRTAEAAWDTTVYVGSVTASMALLMDYDEDDITDFVVGTVSGRLYAYSGNGRDGLWSYSNVGEGHGFVLVEGSRDIDGNHEMDIFGAMENGTVYCFAGSYVGNGTAAPLDPLNPSIPQVLIVDPAYPNPFNSSVIVPVTLTQSGRLTMRVVNVLGREVYQVQSFPLSPGTHTMLWHGSGMSGEPLPSGMYFMEIQSAANRVVRPVELLR